MSDIDNDNDNETIYETMKIELDDKIKHPSVFNNEIGELDQKFILIIEQLSNDITNNKDTTTNMNDAIKLQNELFLLKNSILNNIKKMKDNIEVYDLRINKLLKNNNNLKVQYDVLKQTSNGSKGFSSDTQLLYNQKLMSNLFIGLSIVSSVFVFQKYFN